MGAEMGGGSFCQGCSRCQGPGVGARPGKRVRQGPGRRILGRRERPLEIVGRRCPLVAKKCGDLGLAVRTDPSSQTDAQARPTQGHQM